MRMKTQLKAVLNIHLEQKQAAGRKREQRTSHKRPLGGNEGRREKEKSPGGRLGGNGDSVVERGRRWEVSLVKAKPV